MAEIIGTLSAVIALIETSMNIYDNAQKDIKLSETFEVVRRQLPIIRDTLAVCKSNLEPKKISIPEDVCEALEKTLEACETKASNIRGIFEKIIPGESDTWEKRYSKILRRFGKGNKIEELMLGVAEDVQLIVNHNAVRSANQQQNAELEDIINEMKSIITSEPAIESSTMNFNSGGGAQTNNINRDSGQQIINNGSVGTQNINPVFHKPMEDFGFREPVGVCLGQAPDITPELFIGRSTDIDNITNILQNQQRLVLGGMGGIGKTTLAIAYAKSRSKYYSSVLWFNAGSEAALKGSFRSIAGLIFTIQDPLVIEGEESIRRVHQWLSNSGNTRWLLIFDNYDDPDDFKIDKFLPPTTSHGAIIVTTRRPDRVAGSILSLKPLQDVTDRLKILQTRSKRESTQSDPHAKCPAERLGGLPLALATAGTYLQRSTFTFERYLQEYEKRWNIDPRRPQLREYPERTLYTTWDLSYSHLRKEDPDAAQMLKLFAYFDNQRLWYKLFHAGLTDSSPEWLREVVADDVKFDGVMAILAEYSFLDIHQTFESWSMHNCVHDWTLAALNKDIDTNHYWLVQPRFCQSDAIYTIAPHRFPQATLIAHLLQSQVLLLAAEQMYQRALASYENALGPDFTSTLSIVHNLGSLYKNQGKLKEAEKMYQRALAGHEKALGPDHTSTLDTVHNLGNLYKDQGKLKEAEKIYQRALIGYEKAVGPDHTSTLNIVNNIGNLYNDQGKLKEAKKMYQRALAGYEKALGPDHTSTLNIFNNLGTIYHDQGKLKEAEEIYQQALAGYEKTLGLDHTSTLNTVNNLGSLYNDQGKLKEAEKMFQRALVGYEKALGPGHSKTLWVRKRLSRLSIVD